MHFHDLHIKMAKGEVKTWTNHCRQKHPQVTRTRSWSHVSEWPRRTSRTETRRWVRRINQASSAVNYKKAVISRLPQLIKRRQRKALRVHPPPPGCSLLTWLSSRGCSMALAEPPALNESLWQDPTGSKLYTAPFPQRRKVSVRVHPDNIPKLW